MGVERIILWRHGETDANRDLRIQGSIDIPLNERGRAQARAAAQQLVQFKPSKIYASSLGRAQQTAEELAALVNVPVEIDPRLAERAYGCWEGLTAKEIKEYWHAEWEKWRLGYEPGLDIESREACGERMANAILAAVERAEAGMSEQTLVFASHGGSISCGISTLLGVNPSIWQGLRVMDNCHWAMLIPRPGSNPQWRVVMYNRWNAVTNDMVYGWDKA